MALTRTVHFLALILACSPDKDGDGSPARQDCDDSDGAVFPGARELCDGVDNDCDGLTDEEPAAATFFLDADGDGFGTEEPVPSDSCVPAAGFSARAGDCDDARPDVYPGAPEVCHDDAVNDCLATEPPDCPLSGVIPTRIAIETRPTFDVDFSTIIPYPGEGGQWITLVRSDRGDWVSLGPVLGGRATAGFGDSLLKGAAQVTRLDNDADGTPELLIVLRDGTARVLSGPLRKGTIDVAKEGFEVVGSGYLESRADAAHAVLTALDGRIEAFTLPISAGAAPAVTIPWDRYPNARPQGDRYLVLEAGAPEEGYLQVWDLSRTARVVGEARRPATGRPLAITMMDVDGNGTINLVTSYRFDSGTIVYAYELSDSVLLNPESSPTLWSASTTRLPFRTLDIDQDGRLEVEMGDLSFVRLPTEPGFPPYLQLQDLDSGSLAWLDIDGDGRDEWIGIDTTYQGEGQPLRGFTVLPGNWP